MENDEENKPGRFKRTGVLFLMGTLLGFLYSVGVLFVTPKKYESTSVIQFRPPPETAGQLDERAIATETAILASPKTMKEVSYSLNLPMKWSMDVDDVVTTLTNIVKIEPGGEGDLFEISVRHARADFSYLIANEVPLAYATRKKDERRQIAQQEATMLAKMLLEQRDLINESRANLRTIVHKSGLPRVDEESLTRKGFLAFFDGLPEDERAKRGAELVIFEEARKDLDAKEKTLEFLEQKRIETELKTSLIHEPIIIHGEAEQPRSAVFPNIGLGLLWGLGKGLIFGLVLVLSAALFKRATRGTSDVPEPRGERPSDPADVW
jgi:uncharacterized protein involved in exopolysaccharide biosynthesis